MENFHQGKKKNCGTFVLPTIRIHSQFNLFHLLGLSYAWMLTQVRLGFTLVAYAIKHLALQVGRKTNLLGENMHVNG
jgi:hypothetical protein